MTAQARPIATTSLALLAGPVLFAIGVVLGFASNALIWVGPIDRATFGWAIVVPMCLVAPVVSGLASRRAGDGPALLAALVAAALIGLFFAGSLAASVTQLGCDPNPDHALVLGHAVPVGLGVGVAYVGSAWVVVRLRDRLALAIGAGLGAAVVGGVVSLFIFATQFAASSCAPPPI
jgi:hypothetical protein